MFINKKLALSVVAGLAILGSASPVLAQEELMDDDLLAASVEEFMIADAGPGIDNPFPQVFIEEDVLVARGGEFNLPVPPPMIAKGPGGPGGPGMDCPPGGGPCPPGPCPKMGGSKGFGPFGILSGELALKDEQYEKFHAIKNQALDAMGAKKAELGSLKRDLRDEMMSTNIDVAKVKAIQAKINDANAAIANSRLDTMIAMRNVLSPEQRAELRKNYLRGGFRKGFRGGRHGGFGRGAMFTCPL